MVSCHSENEEMEIEGSCLYTSSLRFCDFLQYMLRVTWQTILLVTDADAIFSTYSGVLLSAFLTNSLGMVKTERHTQNVFAVITVRSITF